MPGTPVPWGAVSGAPNSLAGRHRGRAWAIAPQGRDLAGLLVLVGLYYGVAQLGYSLHFAGPVAAIVWLPAGVGIAFLYLAGLRFWPGIVVGDLLVNNYSALPLGSAVGQTVGNLLEIVLAAAILGRLTGRWEALSTLRGVAIMIAALAAGAAVSATIGVLSLVLGDVIAHAPWRVWRTWVLGDFTGGLIVVPLALAWWHRASLGWLRAHLRQGGLPLLLLGLAGICLFVMDTRDPLTYLIFPPLALAALCFEQRGATVAIAIVSGFTMWATTRFHGPFGFHAIDRMTLNTQLFVAVAAVSTLTLAATVTERTALATRLRAARKRLITAAGLERKRLERDLHDGAQQQLLALAAHLHLSAEEAAEDPSRAGALFEAAHDELLLAIEQLRSLSHGIHPRSLSRLGLLGALRDLAVLSAIHVELVGAPPHPLDEGAESTAYFVIVEGIANAQKHSGADSVEIRFSSRPGWMAVEIIDEGAGGATETAGLGLQGLRDRVEGIGGRIEILSPPGHGTRMTAQIPIT